MGDPAGVGPVIASKAYEVVWAKDGRPFYVIAAPGALDHTSAAIVPIDDPSEAGSAFVDGLPVSTLPGARLYFNRATRPPQQRRRSWSRFVSRLNTRARGRQPPVVTNPIAKALLYRAGFKHPGHTEYLAELAADGGATPRPIMMLVGGGLRVALATISSPACQRCIDTDH